MSVDAFNSIGLRGNVSDACCKTAEARHILRAAFKTVGQKCGMLSLIRGAACAAEFKRSKPCRVKIIGQHKTASSCGAVEPLVP